MARSQQISSRLTSEPFPRSFIHGGCSRWVMQGFKGFVEDFKGVKDTMSATVQAVQVWARLNRAGTELRRLHCLQAQTCRGLQVSQPRADARTRAVVVDGMCC